MLENVSYSEQNLEENLSSVTMEDFLISVEKKAYRMIEIAIRDHGEAMDILQECMIKLVTHYSDKPASEWKPLFYRMIQNKIRDWHRHQKVKNMVFFWRSHEEEDDDDFHGRLSAPDNNNIMTPTEDIEKNQQQQSVIKAVAQLSVKQQQCFSLRSWEGLSVAETAAIMECSQGSVKTHFFRAVNKIKHILEVEHDYTF